jgi:hypothetical protein
MNDDFSFYIKLKQDGKTPENACSYSIEFGDDISFQIKMLRSVYDLDIASARDIVAKAYQAR